MNKVASHLYLLRGSKRLFADVRAVSSATGISMAAFIRDAVLHALGETNVQPESPKNQKNKKESS